MANELSEAMLGSPVVREVEPQLFYDLGGQDAAFLVVHKVSGEQEVLVPAGSEWEVAPEWDGQVTAFGEVNAMSCYSKCKDGKKYRCCDGFCRHVGDC